MLLLLVYEYRQRRQEDTLNRILDELKPLIERMASRYCYAQVKPNDQIGAVAKRDAAAKGVWKAVESFDPWWGLQKGRRPLIFTMDGLHGSSLNQRQIPTVFAQKNYRISANALVHVVESDQKWEIWDESGIYLVVRAGADLQVYEGAHFRAYAWRKIRESIEEWVREEMAIPRERGLEEGLRKILEWRFRYDEPPEYEPEAQDFSQLMHHIWGEHRRVARLNEWLDMLPADTREPLKEALREMVKECIRKHIVLRLQEREPWLLYLGYYEYNDDRERAEAILKARYPQAAESHAAHRAGSDPSCPICRELKNTHDAYRKWHERFRREREAHWTWWDLEDTERDQIRQDAEGFAKQQGRDLQKLNAEQKRQWAQGAPGRRNFFQGLHQDVVVGVLDHVINLPACVVCELEEQFRECGWDYRSIQALFDL